MAVNPALGLNQNADYLRRQTRAGIGDIRRGVDNATPSLEESETNWQGLQDQFQTPQNMYYNSLGLNGQAGSDAAFDAYRGTAGYRNALDAFGMDAETIQRLNASAGNLFSGNTGIALNDRARTLQNMAFGDWQNKLNFTNPLMGAATGRGGALADLSNLFEDEGKNLASTRLAGAGLMSQNAQTLANIQQQQWMQQANETPMWEKLLLGGVAAGGQAAGAYFGKPAV